MISSLAALTQRAADHLGLHVTHSRNTLAAMRRQLLARNPGVTVLDVGANVGDYALLLRDEGFRGAIVSFEPLEVPYATLASRCAADPLWRCARVAVGAADEELEMHVSGNVVSSSLLRPAPMTSGVSTAIAPVRTVATPVARLDTLRGTLWPADARCWLKADVQGYESAVLDGAAATLARTDVVEIELSLVPLYEGQALLHDVLGWLAGAGFRTVWIERALTHPSTNELLQVDALLVREPAAATAATDAR